MDEFILALPIWGVFLFLVVLLPLCVWLGFWFAHFCERRGGYAITEAIPSSIMGVHALLIGFTFSMAISRYEVRRDLVIKDANAIGTAMLRGKTLKAPYNEQSQALFKRYLEHKVQFGRLVYGHKEIASVLENIQKDHNDLWNLGVQVAEGSRTPIEGLFLSALNEVIDTHGERVDALRNRLPPTVLTMLLLTLAASLISFAFVEGVKKRKGGLWLVLLSVLFAVVITLIIDLDRPRRGFITVSQAPIEELYESVSH